MTTIALETLQDMLDTTLSTRLVVCSAPGKLDYTFNKVQ